MATRMEPGELDIREQLVRIDKQLAEIEKLRVDTRYAPWAPMIGTFVAGSAFVGAIAALVKIFF